MVSFQTMEAHNLRRCLLEAVGVLAVGTGLGLGYHALSPSSLSLTRPTPLKELDPRYLTPEETRAAYDGGKTIFIDARDPAEFAKGRVEGALNLPAATFATSYPETARLLPRETPVVVYCGSSDCAQARALADRLAEAGYRELKIFHGGWRVWTENGWPSERGK